MADFGEKSGEIESLVADDDYSGKKGYFVKPGATADSAKLVDVAGEWTLGVITTPAKVGAAIGVVRSGRVYVPVKTGDYTAGQALMVAANGLLTAHVTGNYIAARARETYNITADGQELFVELMATVVYE